MGENYVATYAPYYLGGIARTLRANDDILI